MKVFPRLLLAFAVFAGVLVQCGAAVETEHRRSPYVGAIAVDASNGRVLFSEYAERECYPASCTKLMTARLLLKAISEGRVGAEERIVQSKRSSREEPSPRMASSTRSMSSCWECTLSLR